MIEVLKLEDYQLIPDIYARGFSEDPWEDDWYEIPQFNEHTMWVYKEGMIKGFIISFIIRGNPYISVLTVVPEATRKGIATKLLDQCIDYWSENYDDIYIHVEKDNFPAINLYKKHDFVILREDKKEYYMKRENKWKD